VAPTRLWRVTQSRFYAAPAGEPQPHSAAACCFQLSASCQNHYHANRGSARATVCGGCEGVCFPTHLRQATKGLRQRLRFTEWLRFCVAAVVWGLADWQAVASMPAVKRPRSGPGAGGPADFSSCWKRLNCRRLEILDPRI